ncbi:YafY family transcriptional regulator [Kitasatospora aureofaciens]|uniref:helix-turn-helix transcriptional regulator n=1 Tax=Kitasatospora aureofaciens TaxID=1894 RepID=UPI001C43BDE0|nr:YafY family protein [Kitasatospora aureofaciens]MBV6702651.1 YafY family transcriptional regulator [Kitasatospora aureofaciens]
MDHPVSRVLALLELLQDRPGLTGAELAARLDVDERTVRRYTARLVDLGIPVQADRGRYGGYRLLPGYRLPPLMLTGDEAASVVLGLLAGRSSGLSVGERAAETALAKIQRVLPPGLRERIDAVEQTLGLTAAPVAGPSPAAAALFTLAEAARRRRRVVLAYRDREDRPSERAFDPYGLVFHSGRWYTTGLDHRSGELRTFRLDRIGRVEPREDRFEPPDDFDPVQRVVESLASVPWTHRVEVELGMTLAEARHRLPRSAGTVTELAESRVLLRARAQNLDGVAVMLAGLGRPFTVREPAALRDEVRALADRLTAWSGQGEGGHEQNQGGQNEGGHEQNQGERKTPGEDDSPGP